MEEKKRRMFFKTKMKCSSPNSQSIISKNLLLLLFTLVVISEQIKIKNHPLVDLDDDDDRNDQFLLSFQ